ncbi:MAG: NTP transferase domain-containing protein [Actinomycetota bacterium]|nr:NTP transferase domain-containing protein [Actinomycetota bacterium]
MEKIAGWTIDPSTLTPVLTDRRLIEAALSQAGPVERLFLLPLLGQLDQAIAESRPLLDDPSVRQDPWQVLLSTAGLYLWRHELDAVDRLHTMAWKHARSRSRQASTLQQVGRRWFQYGDHDQAGSCFELALTMRRGFGVPELVAESELSVNRIRDRLRYDAIVLAGGQGARLGGSVGGAKASIPLAGWPLADHVLLAVSGASSRIVVGPNRIALGSPLFCRERPPGAGPVAAIAEAAARISQPTVAVLAADLPFIGPALDTLRECVTLVGRDAGVLVDTTGRTNYLASVWRTAALLQALDGLGDPAGLPVRALYEGRDVAHVPDFDANGADVDTPADLRVAEERIMRRSPGQLPAALLAWPRLELHSPS